MKHSPHRAFADYFGVEELKPFLFALSKKMEDGHLSVNTNSLPDEAEFWKEWSGPIPERPPFPENGTLVGSQHDPQKPFVLHENLLYTGRSFFYETKILHRLQKLAEVDPEESDKRRKKLLEEKEFLTKLQHEFNEPDWQFVAAINGYLNNLTIVTGGPGTGKTTTVAKILAIIKQLEKDEITLALAAPTGKAGMRMKESLMNTVNNPQNAYLNLGNWVEKVDPKTIHSLLGSKGPDTPFFKHDEENPLEADVIVIDESSMIGAGLFAKLLMAIQNGKRLILLGDPNQLASVESGSLFGDLCRAAEINENKFPPQDRNLFDQLSNGDNRYSQKCELHAENSFLDGKVVRLSKTFRYKEGSQIDHFTKAVNNGDADQLEGILKMENQSLKIDQGYSDELFNRFVDGYTKYIQENDIAAALDKFNDLRVLCAVREGERGVYSVNRKIENRLKKRGILQVMDGFYHNQPIMVTQNTPSLGLMNGDVGIIRKDNDGQLKAYFPSAKSDGGAGSSTGVRQINPVLISDWETVFAMTIHKSQGSEFDQVLIILPEQSAARMLTRELLYTAITRAKQSVVIQARLELLQTATSRQVQRVSGIEQRIKI